MKSIKFDSFDVKAIVTKKRRVQHSVKTLSEEKKCDDRNSLVTLIKANQVFQNGYILFQDFTRNIFELHEPETDLTRFKLSKFS